jgi:Domain of unknown function DUF29
MKQQSSMKAAELYDRDFVKWTARNAELLRERRFDQIDIEHVAEEIEDMGKERRSALRSQLLRLLLHLLKYEYQPQRRGTSWLKSIASARIRIEDLIAENPSLKRVIEDMVSEAYPKAVRLASIETKLPQSSFPATCTYPVAHILDPDFL